MATRFWHVGQVCLVHSHSSMHYTRGARYLVTFSCFVQCFHQHILKQLYKGLYLNTPVNKTQGTMASMKLPKMVMESEEELLRENKCSAAKKIAHLKSPGFWAIYIWHWLISEVEFVSKVWTFTSLWKLWEQWSSLITPPPLRRSSWQIRHKLSASLYKTNISTK